MIFGFDELHSQLHRLTRRGSSAPTPPVTLTAKSLIFSVHLNLVNAKIWEFNSHPWFCLCLCLYVCAHQNWHKGCFHCEVCKMTLNMKNYKGYEKKPYCNAWVDTCLSSSCVSFCTFWAIFYSKLLLLILSY